MTRAADLGRRRRLHRISTGGVFALVACDHRDSLRIAFEGRGVAAPEGADIAALKAEIVAALAPAATGILIDAEHGAAVLAGGAGGAPAVVMPLEAQGYADAESGRVTSFLPDWGPDAALAAGADACKLLLPFRADHDASAAAQLEVVARAVEGATQPACRSSSSRSSTGSRARTTRVTPPHSPVSSWPASSASCRWAPTS